MENKTEQRIREIRKNCLRNKHCVDGVSMLYLDEDYYVCKICGAKYPLVYDSETVDKALKIFDTLKTLLTTDYPLQTPYEKERTIEEKLDGLEDSYYCDLEKLLKHNGYEEVSPGRYQKENSLAEIVNGKEKSYAIHII